MAPAILPAADEVPMAVDARHALQRTWTGMITIYPDFLS